jgi:ATP-dependent Clp protease ATP-binding subunit ClpA
MWFSRSTADVRTIHDLLTMSEKIAHHSGDELPGAEHLLLSAILLPDGTARRAFQRIEVDPADLSAAIAAAHADALAAIGLRDPLDPDPFKEPGSKLYRAKPSADQAFQVAAALSKEPGSRRLLGAHVVQAVARQSAGTAARALAALGVDSAALDAAAASEIHAAMS